jgi:hypothetical protein
MTGSGGTVGRADGGSGMTGAGGRGAGDGTAGTVGSGGGGGGNGTGGSSGAGGLGSGGGDGSGGAGGGAAPQCTDITIPSCSSISSPYAMNGWVMNGNWKGYADVFGIGNHIIGPSGYDTTDNYLCAAGALTIGTDPHQQAGFAWNVNQAMSTTAAPMTATPTGGGLMVNAPGTTTTMRVNLNDATTTWCAYLPQAGGGMIPWSSFRTECWPGGQGTAYALQPFLSVQIAAPARESEPTCFCFCVVSIAPAPI